MSKSFEELAGEIKRDPSRAERIDREKTRILQEVNRYETDPAYRLRIDGDILAEQGDDEGAKRCCQASVDFEKADDEA